MKKETSLSQVSGLSLLIALGIIYGDIGTSPLYTLKAIIGDKTITKELVFGSISCIFWTLTLQTTVKYVILSLKMDNHGEGGIFSLFSLLKQKRKVFVAFAIIGGSALLADGIITPPISVASAIEGLRIIYPSIPTVPIVIIIITFLFGFQVFGSSKVGRSFGPIMLVWFTMLGFLGLLSILNRPEIIAAINPFYAYNILVHYPNGFWILGAVFLCTTGAEALYSDMGHCGRKNVRISWIFVKSCLLLNYFGQGAWLISQTGKVMKVNPFFALMPEWFTIIGIGIATLAAIIASQALISGSFTLIGEAVNLNFWPRVSLLFPSNVKGQLFVPSVNILLWLGCMGVVFWFRESSKMEAAYGLSITLTMLMTTLLMSACLFQRKVPLILCLLFLLVYLPIELSFFSANLLKFMHGGYVSLILASVLITVMWVWKEAYNIKGRLTKSLPIASFIPVIKELSSDDNIPKYATHLIYMTGSKDSEMLEEKIIHSILGHHPKKADIYWFVHVEISDNPYTLGYNVESIEDKKIIKINFHLGFRIEHRIGLYFREVVKCLLENKEIYIDTKYGVSDDDRNIGSLSFIVISPFLSNENKLGPYERAILLLYFHLKKITLSEQEWFGLGSDIVEVEKMPLIINPVIDFQFERV